MASLLSNPIFIACWVIMAFIAAFLGKSTRMGFWGTFLIGLILAPLIIFFVIIFQPRKKS